MTKNGFDDIISSSKRSYRKKVLRLKTVKTTIFCRVMPALLLAALMLLSFSACGEKEEKIPENAVYVSIADASGNLVLAAKAVALSDADGDGALTVSDALAAAHDAAYEGGSSAGYKAENGEYGLSLVRLWGTENGGGFGFYVNDGMAMSLADPLKAGDRVNAFVYTDTVNYSDKYCFFDKASLDAAKNTEFTLVLSAVGFDASFVPVSAPFEGAEITVDGEKTGITTDAEGKAVLKLGKGRHVISAVSADAVLVPPVCTVSVK